MTVLRLEDVSASYAGGQTAQVVRGVTLEVGAGETVGLVGESGCGKSTLARVIIGLLAPVNGRVMLDGEPLAGAVGRRPKDVLRRIQIIFQDPYSSLNPRMAVGETLGEAIDAHHSVDRSEKAQRLRQLMDLVGLGVNDLDRHPHEFSGGQRQRIAIARALAVEPDVLIADEITSALDVSVQASILNLLREIQREVGVSCLFISHNLAVVRYLSHRVAVMHLGRIVEQAPSERIFGSPRHPYTRVLLDSLPEVARVADGGRLRALREPADVGRPPGGCDFRERCPVGPEVRPDRAVCAEVDPQAAAESRRNCAACHFPLHSPAAGDSKVSLDPGDTAGAR